MVKFCLGLRGAPLGTPAALGGRPPAAGAACSDAAEPVVPCRTLEHPSSCLRALPAQGGKRSGPDPTLLGRRRPGGSVARLCATIGAGRSCNCPTAEVRPSVESPWEGSGAHRACGCSACDPGPVPRAWGPHPIPFRALLGAGRPFKLPSTKGLRRHGSLAPRNVEDRVRALDEGHKSLPRSGLGGPLPHERDDLVEPDYEGPSHTFHD